jgi:hypothetical protein
VAQNIAQRLAILKITINTEFIKEFVERLLFFLRKIVLLGFKSRYMIRVIT